MTYRQKFVDMYTLQLRKAVETRPDLYSWPVSEVPTVVAKMVKALEMGSYNKGGLGMQWTCKALGIKYTYASINSYFSDQSEV